MTQLRDWARWGSGQARDHLIGGGWGPGATTA
jgi:hypothetical protein